MADSEVLVADSMGEYGGVPGYGETGNVFNDLVEFGKSGASDPTGAGAVTAGAAQLLDVFDGGNAKRERTAKAQRDSARAAAEQAKFELEALKLRAGTPALPSYAPGTPALASGGGAVGGPLAGVRAWLARQSPLGVSWGVVVGAVAVAGVAAYALGKKK